MKIFTPLTLNLTNELYKQMPAKTVGQKILKQRLIRNIERKEFAKMINAEKNNGYSYSDCVKILECYRSALITFVIDDYGLSYDMYLKMKESFNIQTYALNSELKLYPY